jgi:hypothetical protein
MCKMNGFSMKIPLLNVEVNKPASIREKTGY